VKKKPVQCLIPLHSLKNGEHEFHFTLDNTIFTDNQYDDVHNAGLKADINFNKNSSILMLNFNITGTINLTCDRCGDNFDMPVELKRQLIVKTDSHSHQEEDDMVSLSMDEYEFDAAPYIYQYVVLSLPMQRIHVVDKDGKSACNPEVINKLDHIHVEKSSEEQYILNSNKRFSHKENQIKT
jgi:uncharacterized protein